MLKLIADSGSTKAQWLLCGEGDRQVFSTGGINPVHQEDAQIRTVLLEELIPALPADAFGRIGSVCFYGAGVRGEWRDWMLAVLRSVFPQARSIEAESDMLGAARALLGTKRGIACILGTGSNSCLYDGDKIVCSVSPLGYILGDEGSGAVLGRRLLADVMKKQLPEDICRAFWQETSETSENIIRKVYSETLPARYMAGFTKFLSAHRNDTEIQKLIIGEFEKFFIRNLRQYDPAERVANFVGSIAYVFSDELRVAAARQGFDVGTIIRAPIDRLGE